MSNPFASFSRVQWIHFVVVLLCTIGAIIHNVVFWEWVIEDAAITFAFAKHLAEGEGLVPFYGGERVEGYSNPTWTFLIAGLYWLGADPFIAVRWIQVIQTAITVPVSYLLAREGFRDRPDNYAVLLAPALVAGNSQFAIYGGAGLENGLLNMLMAIGMWRMLVEARKGGIPWSALVWLLVAMTRPESITYAAVAGFLSMVFHLQSGRGLKPTLYWLLLFWPPFLAYHAWRYNYFAWPFPNTYYAKLDHRGEKQGYWGKIPWRWQRNWAHEMSHGYYLGIYLFGVIGHGRAWRYLAVAVALLLVGGSIEMADDQRWLLPVVLCSTYMFFALGLTWGGQEPPRALVGGGLVAIIALFGLAELLRYQGMSPNDLPQAEFMKEAPKYLLVIGALIVPLLGVGSPGWRTRVTCWLMCFAGTFFAVWAEFDWMKGYRWYATIAVPGSVVLAMGVDSMLYALADWLRVHGNNRAKLGGVAWGLAVLAGMTTVHVLHTKRVAEAKDPSPNGIRVRVNFVDSVRDRLFVDDERWIDLDVDQGGHLYWSDFEMLDIAGLIDVPLGHHKFDKPFVREYLFQEKKPHFAHVHGGWAGNSKIPTHPEWRRDYIEIPGFPVGGGNIHIGNYVRKDLLLVDRSPFPASQRTPAAGGVVFEGFSIPVEPAKARSMYVEVGVSKAAGRSLRGGDFRLMMAAKGPGGTSSWDVPLGYDWWMPSDWPNVKVHHGKHALPLPPHLKPGTYDVSFTLLDAEGEVLPMQVPGEPDPRPPLFAKGERRFDGALTIVEVEVRAEAAKNDREAAIVAANEGRCDEATELWFTARRRRPVDEEWVTMHRPRVNTARAGCAIREALATDDREEQLDLLERARFLDRHHPELAAAVEPLVTSLWAEGMEEREQALALTPEAPEPPMLTRVLRKLLPPSLEPTWEPPDEMASFELSPEAKHHWERSYRLFSDLLRLDPSWSWARRYAEEARAYRLGIDPISQAVAAASKAQREAQVEERRQEYEAKRKAREQAKKKEAKGAGAEDDE